ncbi:MAG TPA: hypothetical protein VGG78_06770, partial [Gemmatimonadaceae bacterium]
MTSSTGVTERSASRWWIGSLLAALMGAAAWGCATARATSQVEQHATATPVTPYGVDSALQRIVAGPTLWPGFQPQLTPVAIYDGRATVLFRHPNPPSEFVSLSRERGVYARAGRDPLVTANTSVMLGGKPTATVMLDTTSALPAGDWAALTTHEIFHVFQRERHPSWVGNEADYFTYPLDDTTALALRRVETLALSRALGAGSRDSVRCWTRAAMVARAGRFDRIGAAAAAYERGPELNEGLATYVERRAAGHAITLAATDLPADQVRQRSYGVGAALAELLDRLREGWRDSLEHAPESAHLTLDSLLAESVAPTRSGTGGDGSCGASAAELALASSAAMTEVRSLREQRARERANFMDRPGWRLVVQAGAKPLFLQRFDPLNVSLVSPTEILHRRTLRLGNDAGWIELLDRASLTEGREGEHPLFAGVRRLTVGASTGPVSVRDSAGTTLVDGEGIRA